MTDPPRTSVATLLRAAQFGRQAGLRHVYAGNLPGQVGEWEDTRCPHCAAALVRRYGFTVLANRLDGAGRCADCHVPVAGVWG